MKPKFSVTPANADADEVRHIWPWIYGRVPMGSKEALLVGIANSGIDLILRLTADDPGPFGILYVLVVARPTKAGRYQLKNPLDSDAFQEYLERNRLYFEGDGRHHLWIRCGDGSLIVYDRHEMLYLYGDLNRFSEVLDSMGYSQGRVAVDFPHSHHYNQEFDLEEKSITESDEYMRFNLVPGVDYPRDDPRFSEEN